MVEDENKGLSERQKKIAAVTLLTASVAFIASTYLISEESEEDHVFAGITDKKDLHRAWLEYNRLNHPDKCVLEGDALTEHMQRYYETKSLYEKLLNKR